MDVKRETYEQFILFFFTCYYLSSPTLKKKEIYFIKFQNPGRGNGPPIIGGVYNCDEKGMHRQEEKSRKILYAMQKFPIVAIRCMLSIQNKSLPMS